MPQHKTINLQDCIAHAKSRCMDDMRAMLDDHNSDEWSKTDWESFKTLCAMIAMPDNKFETLAALSVNYFNGHMDTLFEDGTMSKALRGYNVAMLCANV